MARRLPGLRVAGTASATSAGSGHQSAPYTATASNPVTQAMGTVTASRGELDSNVLALWFLLFVESAFLVGVRRFLPHKHGG